MNDDSGTARPRNHFLEALGRVTMAGAELDASLHSLLGALTLEPTLLYYTNDMGTDKLIQVCQLALTVHRFQDADIAELRDCLKRADQLRIRRNNLVHSLYTQAEAGGGFEAMKPVKKSIGYSVTPVSPEEMEELAHEIHVLRSDLFAAGWNARADERPGCPRIPKWAPEQIADGTIGG